MSDSSVSSLLKKTEHYDKDERYMATSDLCEVLKRQQDAPLDTAIERQICTAVLRLLHDKSNDVQAIAVKTLGVLLTTVQQEQVLEIADSLADQVLDASKSELRDVYAIGLRTLVKTVPAAVGDRVSQRLVGRLLDGIRTSANEEIVLACLDVLTDLLSRFGATAVSLSRQHEPILQMCLSQLGSQAAVVRKRAGNTLACLSVVLSDALLQRMVESLLTQIDMADGVGKEGRRKAKTAQKERAAGPVGDTRALIRTMCTVSGRVGHRLGQEQIDRILPIFLRFTDPEDAVTGDDDDQEMDEEDEEVNEDATALANELRESCFMGFESFVLRCPTEVEPHLKKIIQAALAYASYDPNYAYGNTESDEPAGNDDEDFEAEDEEEYDEEDEEAEEDDDDDESWKVRRSAIRALRAVVEAKKHDPTSLWTTSYTVRRGRTTVVAAALVGRFKEREENCRVGIIDCFTRLLSVTVDAASAGVVTFKSKDEMDTSSNPAVELHDEYAPKLVKACEKILSSKKANERSKSSALALLAALCRAPGGIGGKYEIASVFKHIESFLSERTDMSLHREGSSKALRLDALSLVHSILASGNHDPVDIRESLFHSLLPQLCEAVKEQWYKVIAEVLRALAEVPRIFIQGFDSSVGDDVKEQECAAVATQVFTAIEPLLAAHDVDQEIKECALKAAAALLSSLHASLQIQQKNRLLELLLERLKNETTRIAAIKTLSSVASAESSGNSRIDLSPILADSISTIASFLKLQSRSLKQTSLEALETVITNHGSLAGLSDGALYSKTVQDFAPLIVDSDLHLSHRSLRVAVSILTVCPAAGPAVKAYILEPALALSTSPLLQDAALESLLAAFQQMVASSAVDFNELLFLLRQRLDENITKPGIYCLSKSIAAITTKTTQENGNKVLDELFSTLETGTAADAMTGRKIQLSLLVTGDIGKVVDYSTIAGASDKLNATYMNYFESPSEELRSAAAHALGNASVGSPGTFLPAIVRKLDENNKKQQYLLLLALREFIQCSAKKSDDSTMMIVPPLLKHFAESEEGVRTMVAECMGSLVCQQPAKILPQLAELQQNQSNIHAPGGIVPDDDEVSKANSFTCWTIVTSIKLAIAGRVDASLLSLHMPTFVRLLQQEELKVRNAALLMVYSAVHHMPQAVSSLLKDSIMPSLFDVAGLKVERKVDLGPFTHTVDDALPLRKSALSIFSTCLENLPGSIDIPAFMPVLAKALGDAEDVQLHAYQIVISMCARQPTYIIASVESFVEPLEKTINKKAGQREGTELERLNDWIKSALRVVITLSNLEGTMNSRKFADFVERIKGNSKFHDKITTIQEENKI